MSWLDELHDERQKLAAQNADPWRLRLERVHGKIGDDGIERITTQLLFDILEVPQRSRGAGACRRLAKLMAELGWMAVRVRGLTRGGYLSKCAGTAANRSTTPDQQVASADCVDFVLPINSKR
jgi:hypothetical protein